MFGSGERIGRPRPRDLDRHVRGFGTQPPGTRGERFGAPGIHQVGCVEHVFAWSGRQLGALRPVLAAIDGKPGENGVNLLSHGSYALPRVLAPVALLAAMAQVVPAAARRCGYSSVLRHGVDVDL